MYRNDLGAIRHRNAFRNEISMNGPGRFLTAFPTRRPLLRPRRRAFGNRFPRQTFRPFTQNPRMVGIRIEHPNMNSNHQGPQNFPRPFIPPHSEQCEFPRNNFENFPRNEFPPAPFRMATDFEAKSSNYGIAPVFNFQEELWIETMSETGKLYYYNSNSRATTWNKPENVKIMNLTQLKALAISQYNGQTQDQRMQNGENICRPMNGCFEHGSSAQNLTASPSSLIAFPPPNMYIPPPFFTPPTINYSLPEVPMNPPDVFHTAEISVTSASDDKTNVESHVGDVVNPTTMDHENMIIASTLQTNQRNSSEKQEKANISSELYSKNFKSCRKNKENNIECKNEQSPVTNEFPIFMEEDCRINNISQNMECIQDSKDKIEESKVVSSDEEDKLKWSSSGVLSDTINEGVENSEKSRPVSSTQIPGSKWCVVWTGDNKVFFYDAYHKVSVWNTPEELINRAVVKKLIEFPPTLESQENISSESQPKKIKIELKSSPAISEPLINYSDEQPSTIQEIVSKATKKREDIPHETRVQMFMEMLSEKKVSAFSTWEKELHKIVFDTRYLLLAPKERKQKFEVYVHTKIDEEKKSRKKKIATMKENYAHLLEEAGVSQNTRFPDFAHKYASDSRFQAIERTREKERLFDRFIHNLHRATSENSSSEKQTLKFLELLKEHQDCLNANSTWSEFKKKISGDGRYLAFNSEARKESLFQDFIIQKYFSRASSNSKGKEERVMFSLQTRRKEVERNMSLCMKELEEERLLYKHESLTNGFTAMLVDLVRNPDMKYRDAMKCLKADHRWETVGDLRTNERERLFDDHVHQLKSRKKDKFYKLLDELFKEIELTSTWKDVKKTIRRDERCAHFFDDEKKCEKEFNDYMKKRLKTAKMDFRDLLKETKIITYASKTLMKNTNHLENVEDALAKDKRFLVLQCIESERKKMLMSHIEGLYVQGPPPPPTASEPSRR